MKLICVLVAAAAVPCACTSNTGGDAVAGDTTEPTMPATSATSAVETTSSLVPTIPDMPAYGVVETTRRPLERDAQTCEPPQPPAGTHQAVFEQSAPDSPRITIALPDTWTSAVAQDNSMMSMTGPGGLSGTLRVWPTDLEPAEAFEKYSDDVTAAAPISSVSVLPAELCGYSGQKLMITLSGGDGPPVEYEDRIAHIGTDGPAYLAAIHIEGPQGEVALSDASALILGDFGIRLP